MSDNKVIAIIAIGFFAFAISVSIWGGSSTSEVQIEQEKTQQLRLQYKIDSIADSKIKK